MGLLVLNVFSAAAMTGVIWMVQVVHYPLFAAVGTDGWAAYHRGHTTRIAYVVVPLMVTELATSALLLDHGALAVVGLALALTTWVATFALAVPRHTLLDHGFDAAAARGLVTTGWVRTAAWTAHAGVALALLARY